MAKRTQRQIELDCKRIQETAKTATSMKEIAEITGLTQSEIRTSLSKHPRISKKIQKQVEENKSAFEAKIVRKDIIPSETKVSRTNEKRGCQNNNNSDFEMGFVIDTSMVEIDAIEALLEQIFETEAKVVLTSVVRQELNVMQGVKKDHLAYKARRMMALALQRPEKFYNALIDESFPIPDDCIVNYCVENKERVILLTADKNMALDAREKSVKVEFFRQNFKYVRTINDIRVPKKGKRDVRTLNPAQRVGNKLLIMEMQGKTRDICVLSEGKESVDGIVELKIGDDVLIAAKKSNGITFAHYQMITLYGEDNCRQLFFKKILDYNEIDNFPKDFYKEFAKQFWNKHGFNK